jgi:hypothetical protein
MISVEDVEDLNIKLVSERAKVREVCPFVASKTLAYVHVLEVVIIPEFPALMLQIH